MRFANKKEAKSWIVKYNLNLLKPFKVKESNKRLLEVVCTEPTCAFYFKASVKKGKFVVKQLSGHSCDIQKQRTTAEYISEVFKPSFEDFGEIKPKKCIRHLLSSFGIPATYMQAYRGLKSNKKVYLDAEKEGYRLIGPWLEWMAANNTGSVFEYKEKMVAGSEVPSFEYCFYMPGSSATLFNNSLPIITLDACHTKGNYRGVLFVATAITGDNKGAIIAYGIGPTENYEYWKMFVTKLKVGLNLQGSRNLVILSDREKGLAQSVREELPNASHSYCVFHMEKNIKSRFSTDTNGLLWKAARASTVSEFNDFMNMLQTEKGSRVYQFVASIPPTFWARSHFPVPRYGHITSNIAESMNASIGEEIRKMSVLDILIALTNKLFAGYATSYDSYAKVEHLYPPKLCSLVEIAKQSSLTLEIRSNPRSPQIQIQDDTRSSLFRIFNKDTQECSCNYAKEFGIPCRHIFALIRRHGFDETSFIHQKRKNISLMAAYEGIILFCDLSTLEKRTVDGAVERIRRGRPRTSTARIISIAERVDLRRRTCRICQELGHNARTCPQRNPGNGVNQ